MLDLRITFSNWLKHRRVETRYNCLSSIDVMFPKSSVSFNDVNLQGSSVEASMTPSGSACKVKEARILDRCSVNIYISSNIQGANNSIMVDNNKNMIKPGVSLSIGVINFGGQALDLRKRPSGIQLLLTFIICSLAIYKRPILVMKSIPDEVRWGFRYGIEFFQSKVLGEYLETEITTLYTFLPMASLLQMSSRRRSPSGQRNETEEGCPGCDQESLTHCFLECPRMREIWVSSPFEACIPWLVLDSRIGAKSERFQGGPDRSNHVRGVAKQKSEGTLGKSQGVICGGERGISGDQIPHASYTSTTHEPGDTWKGEHRKLGRFDDRLVENQRRCNREHRGCRVYGCGGQRSVRFGREGWFRIGDTVARSECGDIGGLQVCDGDGDEEKSRPLSGG
ncbi:hypothetical protein AKJ16_DCAP15033 [Drosera capensis]